MKHLITLIFILFLLNACDRIKKTETETFVVDGDFTTLDVDVTAGGININNPQDSDNSTIDLIVEKFAYAPTEAEALAYIEDIEIVKGLSGKVYSVKVETPEQDDPNIWGGANLTFNNIDQQQLVLKSTAGSVDCEDITLGDFDLTAGTVTVDSVTGPLVVKSAAGSIDIDEYWGDDLDLTALAGSVGVDIKGSGPIDAIIDVTAGSVLLGISEDRSCDVELETEVGSISVSGVGDYDINSPFPGISKEISFSLNEGTGEIIVNTFAGTIDVDVK